MKLTIRGQDDKREPEVEFWLVECGDGTVVLMAQMTGGHPRQLLSIYPNGSIGRVYGASGLGEPFEYDDRGRIVIE